jgi:acetyl-CoA C-acetyltransferase
MTKEAAKRGLKPLAKIVAHRRPDPSEFTLAPIGSISNLLKKLAG